ncbi:MAG: hypothetical protein ACP5JE_03830 [Thermoplasmata archaeon]
MENRPQWLKVVDNSKFTVESLITTGRVYRTYEIYPGYTITLRTLLAKEANEISKSLANQNADTDIEVATRMLVKLNDADYTNVVPSDIKNILLNQAQPVIERINTAILDFLADVREIENQETLKKN